MVNFSKLDTKSLIEAAMTPSSSPPRTSQPKQLTPYTLEEPETVDTVSRKRTRTSDEARLSDDSISGSDSSEETFVAKPRKKKQKQLVDDDGVVYDAPQRPLRNKGKGRASMAEQIDDDDDNDDDDNNAALQPVKSTRPKSTSTSRKSSSSSRKASTAPKPRKPVGTPVPTSLEDAHPADKELFKMKADGKPWKQIKPVWEKLMCKQTGDSTLSVRYYKMKENFAKAGGKDVRPQSMEARWHPLLSFFASACAARATPTSTLPNTPSLLDNDTDSTLQNRTCVSSNSRPKSKPSLKPTNGSGSLR